MLLQFYSRNDVPKSPLKFPTFGTSPRFHPMASYGLEWLGTYTSNDGAIPDVSTSSHGVFEASQIKAIKWEAGTTMD